MGAFGDNLRREREMRGVTLAEISESTKISKRWLQALEDEDFKNLPGGVFNRGFVRAYAHFLGINEEEAVADYIAASGEQPPPDDKFPLEIHEKHDSKALNPRRSPVPLLLAVVGLVLVIGAWTFWVRHKALDSATKASSSGTPASSEQQESLVSTPNERQRSGGQGKRNGQHGGTREIHISARPDDSGADPSGSISVVIKAKESSWISIAADGQPIWNGTLTANDERSVTADRELILKTGNAAGIEVSYNGKPLGNLGGDKQVRTLTFNTAGLIEQ